MAKQFEKVKTETEAELGEVVTVQNGELTAYCDKCRALMKGEACAVNKEQQSES